MEKVWNTTPETIEEYISHCKKSATDGDLFKVFRKRQGAFCCVVENGDYGSAIDNYKFVKENYPFLLPHFDKFLTSEKVGTPETYFIPEAGISISSTTMRYIKTLGEIYTYFGSLDGLNIAEIGAGYGGQCKIIYDMFKPASYTIYDISETLMLQKRFLEEFKIKAKFHDQLIEPQNCDLIISWCSWSELIEPLRREYAEKVISKSKNCYHCFNFDMEQNFEILKPYFNNHTFDKPNPYMLIVKKK